MKTNKQLIFILFLLLTVYLFSDDTIHVLEKGETLYSLSRKYNISASALMEYNNITNANKLFVGQKIVIPNMYKVQKGDTLYGIAKKYNISVQDLISFNNIDLNYILKVDETIKIPATKESTKDPEIIVTKQNLSNPTSAPVPSKSTIEDPRVFISKPVDANLLWPVSAIELSYLTGKLQGVSITAKKGEPVKNIASGTVISSGPYRGFGQVVFVQSKTGYIYVYGGLDGVQSKTGQQLAFGDEIGYLGSDALSGKPQLYFMVYNKNLPIDPAKAPRG